eukprot:COSAG02_NODE_3732_length_6312_cov_10.672944_3_plen_54_part_00
MQAFGQSLRIGKAYFPFWRVQVRFGRFLAPKTRMISPLVWRTRYDKLTSCLNY